MKTDQFLPSLDDYEELIGAETVDRIRRKARSLIGQKVVHVNSTMYGGGVAEMLDPLSLLMNSLGIDTEWHAIQGTPDFFAVTKSIHNAIQGAEFENLQRRMGVYEQVVAKNALRMHLARFDYVVIHDPQPLSLIKHFRKRCPWIWRCHLDLTHPNPDVWNYMTQAINLYDAMIVSAEFYRQNVSVPQRIFMPAIDPFSIKNQPMTEEQIEERLKRYLIPTDLPLVVQISRFDRWKDPTGVIEAVKKVRKEINCTLVLLGNLASDDPEGTLIYQSLIDQKDDRIILISQEDSQLVNALQRRAAVILQKSLREGFGLTVAEAMWKGTPVIGGNVGGIRLQIQDGQNGFLVSTVDEAADRILRLLRDGKLRAEMGRKAHETVKEHFLLSRLLEQYVDLFNGFEIQFRLRP